MYVLGGRTETWLEGFGGSIFRTPSPDTDVLVEVGLYTPRSFASAGSRPLSFKRAEVVLIKKG